MRPMNWSATRRRLKSYAGALLLGALLAGGLPPGAAVAQSEGDDAIGRLERAFAEGAARDLLAPAPDRVEMGLLEATTLYTRSQAVYVLQDFFKEYPPVRVELEDPTVTSANRFVAGQYWHEGADRPLQLYLQLEERGGAWQLRSLRIQQRP